MNCADLRRLLAFEDATLAPDPDAVRAHLQGCVACRREHFDVAALFCVGVAPTRAPAWRRAAAAACAAALLIAAAVVLGAVATERAPALETGGERAAIAPRRVLPQAGFSRVTTEVTSLAGGRRQTLYALSQHTGAPLTRSAR